MGIRWSAVIIHATFVTWPPEKPDAGEGDEEPAIAGKEPVVVAIVTSMVA